MSQLKQFFTLKFFPVVFSFVLCIMSSINLFIYNILLFLTNSFSLPFLHSHQQSLWFLSFSMRGTQGEVIWPRLVANKILRKGWGSSNFVADFPSNRESLLDTTSSESFDHGQTCLNSNSILYHHQDIHKYKVFVSTWNVGGVEPKEDLKLEDLLDTSSTTSDIYVLGFQEIVPLKASNVLGTENTKISTKWNSLIREALNKKRPTGRQDEGQQSQTLHENHSKKNVHDDKNMHPNKEGKSIEISTAPQDFQCIISKQMVGILISVWVRGDLRPFIRYPNVDCVGCGIMGCLGNKGSVSARFQLHETNFCFVCSHLTSGDRMGDQKIRNSNVAEIFSRTSFPGQPLLDLPRKILDHDQVIFFGDLNYRISSAEDLTRYMVKKKDWNALLKKDQLRMELINGDTLRNWHEGVIKFAPTYKYLPNSDVYYGGSQHKKNGKRRAPAWCDRIIWRGKGIKQHLYTRSESRLSDHRPVKAIFTTEVKVLQARQGNHQGLFLSERFEQLKNKFDVSSTNEFRCKKSSSFQL